MLYYYNHHTPVRISILLACIIIYCLCWLYSVQFASLCVFDVLAVLQFFLAGFLNRTFYSDFFS